MNIHRGVSTGTHIHIHVQELINIIHYMLFTYLLSGWKYHPDEHKYHRVSLMNSVDAPFIVVTSKNQSDKRD